MRKRPLTTRVLWTALLAVALASLGLAGPVQAKLVKEFTKFNNCPWKNTEVKRCIYSVTNSGEVKLGSKTVPIEKAVTLQGGFGKADAETKISAFFAPTSGDALAKVSQNVPGGLLGIVPDASSPWLVKKLIKFFTENKITGLGSTLELAKPASEIQISEFNMSRKENVALKMPLQVHLENPFLGSKCYVGSSSSPITWNLTSGVTAPPGPNKAIEGSFGQASFLEGGFILHLTENKLVDNAWSAPKAAGCGGLLAFLVNPIVNAQLGTTTAGNNTAILVNTVDIATTGALKIIDEENP
jgi:hypothetical protein